MDSDNKLLVSTATGGISTAEKISIEKLKRTVMQGGTAAPTKVKSSIITVKLKPN
jgi:hypothetical protein